MVNVHKDIRLQGWEIKSILRKTVGNKLPQKFLSATHRGFGVPVREWFKDNSFQSKLNELMKLGEILDRRTLKKIIDKNKDGKRDNGNFIWGLFLLNKILISV